MMSVGFRSAESSNAFRVAAFRKQIDAFSTAGGHVYVVAAIHRDEEVLLVDMKTGHELERITRGSPVRAARIVSGKDRRLFVLTAGQTVHRLPSPNRDGAPAAASPQALTARPQ